MKTLRFLLSIIIGVFCLISCSIEPEDEETYYQFDETDEPLIIKYKYKVDQIIVYENQYGEKLHFKVISNERGKRSYYSPGTFSGGSTFSHFYENQIIRFEILENPYTEVLSGDHSKVNYLFSKNFGKFNNGMNFPMWNIILFSFMDQIQNSANIYLRDFNENPRMTVNVNGHQFVNTVVINSNSKEAHNSFQFGPLPQNVNKIYYDYDFGIVQFDEIKGTQWKVIYPE